MKVLLLGFTKISYMPYMHFYIEQMKLNKCEISLLYWDRDGKADSDLPDGITPYKFSSYIEDSIPLRCKISSFIKYRRYAKEVLRKYKFDLLVIMHSTPGIVLYDILRKKYRKRYILDYRDFTYENIRLYKYFIQKLVNNSIGTFVSSDAYRKYLPERGKIFTAHNIILDSLKYRDIRRLKNRERNTIRIRFWGFIRGKEINTRIIDTLGNDDRFELHYHGREQETGRSLRKYCESNSIKNVYFHGNYKPEDRYLFGAETDLIHNIYENDTKTVNAMGNKFYDGVAFYIPQLCNSGSFMGKKVEKMKLGATVDLGSTKFADDIFRYYHSINWNEFEKRCDQTLEAIMKEYNTATEMIQQILNNKYI